MVPSKCVKILLILTCGVALVVLSSGCKKNGEQPPDRPAPNDTDVSIGVETTSTTTDHVVEPDKPPPVIGDSKKIVPGSGMGPLVFGMSKDEIIGVLGEPDIMEGGGIALMYPSKGLSLILDLREGLREVSCWSKQHPMSPPDAVTYDGKTQEGIGLGATREQVVAAYGEPDSTDSRLNVETLNYNKLKTQFSFFQNTLVGIKLKR